MPFAAAFLNTSPTSSGGASEKKLHRSTSHASRAPDSNAGPNDQIVMPAFQTSDGAPRIELSVPERGAIPMSRKPTKHARKPAVNDSWRLNLSAYQPVSISQSPFDNMRINSEKKKGLGSLESPPNILK